MNDRTMLRPYQQSAKLETIRKLPRNPLLVSPTGTGKTHMAVAIARSLGGRMLWIAHRRELIFQARDHLARHYRSNEIDIIMASEERRRNAIVHVASIQTLRNREFPDVDVIFVDEAHHSASSSYRKIFNQRAPVIGLTATPYRLDGKPLAMFGAIVNAITPAQAVAEGYLMPSQVFACEQPNLAEVRNQSGDFHQGDLGRAMNKPRIVGNIIREWSKRCLTRQTLVFASSIKHSESITGAFIMHGISAAHLDANTPSDERTRILRNLADGTVQVVSNVGILTEGYDLPKLGAIIIARPTQSLCLHQQMIGRVLRPDESERRAIIHDHAGNHHRHGPFTRPLEFSLTGKVKTAITTEPQSFRTCDNCLAVYPSGKAFCPVCMTGTVSSRRDDLRKAKGDLIEFDDNTFDYKQAVWNTIKNQEDAVDVYERRFKERPTVLAGELIDPENISKKEKKKYYSQLISQGYDHKRAKAIYKNIFGKKPFWQTRGFKSWEKKKGIY